MALGLADRRRIYQFWHFHRELHQELLCSVYVGEMPDFPAVRLTTGVTDHVNCHILLRPSISIIAAKKKQPPDNPIPNRDREDCGVLEQVAGTMEIRGIEYRRVDTARAALTELGLCQRPAAFVAYDGAALAGYRRYKPAFGSAMTPA